MQATPFRLTRVNARSFKRRSRAGAGLPLSRFGPAEGRSSATPRNDRHGSGTTVKIDRILESGRPSFSFEFFPPKDDAGMQALLATTATLRELEPAFVSVTYGAGGSTRTRTIDVTKRIKKEIGLEAMAHLTCVGATSDQLRATLRDIAAAGIENVLALRGDPPQDPAGAAAPRDLQHAAELVSLAATEHPFCIGGACFPEKHPEAPDLKSDLRYLREKVEAGASFLITQLFFENEFYFSFVERARRAGIGVPIIPGIMPITSAQQIARFTSMCGATIPERLLAQLRARDGQPEAVLDLGVAYATLQCVDLLARGAPGIHFYTLNKSPATRAVVSSLQAARPWEPSGGHRYLDSADAILESTFEA